MIRYRELVGSLILVLEDRVEYIKSNNTNIDTSHDTFSR
jgi:hypothetical protein